MSLRRALRRGALSAVVVAVLGLLAASPASAHAELVGSNPANGARLDSAPSSVTMTFTESVSLVDGGILLLDSAGSTVRTPDPAVVGHKVTWPMPARLPAGAYTATWRVVSSDGHPVAGAFSFGVGTSPQSVADPSAGASDLPPWPVTAAQLVGTLSFTLLAGVVGWLLWCAPTDAGNPRLRVLARAGLSGGLVATAAMVLLRGPWITGGSWATVGDPTLLRETLATPVGRALLFRLVLYGGLCSVLWTLRRLEPLVVRSLVLAALVSAALTFGAAGHGAASGSPIDVAVDAVHAMSAGLWAGGLLVLVVAGSAVERRALLQFSGLAMMSVIALVASGLYNSVRHVEGVNGLWLTRYGQILSVKVLVLGLVLLAASLSRHRLRKGGSPLSTVKLEAVGTSIILVLTAVLTLTSPSVRGATLQDVGAHAHDAGVGDVVVKVPLTDGRVAQIQVAPPRTSGSLIRVRLLDARQRISPVKRIQLKVSLPSQGIVGIQVPLLPGSDPSTWAGSCTFPLPGKWTMTVSVEDPSLSAVVATGSVEVAKE